MRGLANRWFQPLTHVSDGGFPRVSAVYVKRDRREKRGEYRFVMAQRVAQSVRRAFQDWALAQYLGKRGRKCKATICRRKSDGTLWAASSPQNMGYAMRGIFSGLPSFHFAKVRIWRGVPVVVPKLFWAFREFGQFEIAAKDTDAFWLEPWPMDIECAKIDAPNSSPVGDNQ